MSITRPNAFTQLFEEDFANERPVSEELLRKLIQNTNMLRALMPAGMVKAYQVNMPGVKLPSAEHYEPCDGGEVQHGESPLLGAEKPNMQGRFLRGAFPTDTPATEQGGSATINLPHAHSTNVVYDGGNRLEAGDERRAFEPFHSHGISTENLSQPSDPAHIQVGFYLKISV